MSAKNGACLPLVDGLRCLYFWLPQSVCNTNHRASMNNKGKQKQVPSLHCSDTAPRVRTTYLLTDICSAQSLVIKTQAGYAKLKLIAPNDWLSLNKI